MQVARSVNDYRHDERWSSAAAACQDQFGWCTARGERFVAMRLGARQAEQARKAANELRKRGRPLDSCRQGHPEHRRSVTFKPSLASFAAGAALSIRLSR